VKRIFQKNQIMITALALMLAVAGYFSFMNKDISDPNMVAEASADSLKEEYEISDEDYKKFFELDAKYGKNQFLVPYFISSHPGCTLRDAVGLAEYLNSIGHMPEQVQDFYPTPGTIATCMYYTGIDPNTMEKVYVPREPGEKAMQRALLQWRRPECRELVKEALKKSGREDLIGTAKRCLIRPDKTETVRRKNINASNPYEKKNSGWKGRRGK